MYFVLLTLNSSDSLFIFKPVRRQMTVNLNIVSKNDFNRSIVCSYSVTHHHILPSFKNVVLLYSSGGKSIKYLACIYVMYNLLELSISSSE